MLKNKRGPPRPNFVVRYWGGKKSPAANYYARWSRRALFAIFDKVAPPKSGFYLVKTIFRTSVAESNVQSFGVTAERAS